MEKSPAGTPGKKVIWYVIVNGHPEYGIVAPDDRQEAVRRISSEVGFEVPFTKVLRWHEYVAQKTARREGRDD